MRALSVVLGSLLALGFAPKARADLVRTYDVNDLMCREAATGIHPETDAASGGSPIFRPVGGGMGFVCTGTLQAEVSSAPVLRHARCNFLIPTEPLPHGSMAGTLCIYAVDASAPFPADVQQQLDACASWGIACRVVSAPTVDCAQYVVMGHGLVQEGVHIVGPKSLPPACLACELKGTCAPAVLNDCHAPEVPWAQNVLPLGPAGDDLDRREQLAATYCQRHANGDTASERYGSCMQHLMVDDGLCDQRWWRVYTPQPVWEPIEVDGEEVEPEASGDEPDSSEREPKVGSRPKAEPN